MFGSNNMKEMAKVVRDVMKLGAHGDMPCSALQFVLWDRALSSEKKEG